MNNVVKNFKKGNRILLNKSSGIRKMLTAAGGPILISTLDIKNGANLLGSLFLRGLGTVGQGFAKVLSSPNWSGSSATNNHAKDIKQAQRLKKESDSREQSVAKGSVWLSPLNYGTALATGNGLNARKGNEEIEKLEPWLQALLRGSELYIGPKAVKGVKAAPRAVVNTAAKAGVKPAKTAVIAREIKLGIKQNTKNGRIEVTGNYFNSPDKWYRITERPEKIGIEEQGKNVTTADSPEILGTINGWRTSVLDNSIETGKGVNEGYFVKKPKKINLSLRRIHGRAHGNTSQAAKGQLWQANTAGSNIFPGGVIEGEAPLTIPYGLSRTHFVNTPWEEVPTGGRIGFHTGEMPISNLGWFQRTNKGTYTYEPIIPEKRIPYNPVLLKEPRTSLKFFERKPFNSKLKKSEEAGVPKSERNNRLHGEPLAPYYDYSLINKHYEPWTVNEKGQFVFASPEESKKLGTIHFSMNEPVMDHFMGSWGDAPTVTMLPYRNMRSQTAPVDLAIMDTFFPNYNGLKVSSRGSKTLTGDRATYEYYKSKGIDVEFSPEMEVLLQKLLKNKSRLEPLTTSPDFDYYSPKVQKLYEEQASLKEAIDQITRNWSRKHVKTIPSFDKLTEFGKAEGLNMDKYPYLLGSNGRWTTRASRELGLDYTWLSDPTNHAVFLLNPKYALLRVLSGEYGNVRPEYVKYLKWIVDHKADYRKKGGKINVIEFLQKGKPITTHKNLKTVRTIKINNGTLVAKMDSDDKIHWFRNNEEMTPNQIKTYKYYDPKIKNHRRLGNINGRVKKILYLVKDSVVSPIYTPSIDKIADIYRANRKNKIDLNKKQAVPFNGEYITLRTKGNMNLADIPINLLDSIAINSGRSNTNFWKNSALVGKESTFGGISRALGKTDSLSLSKDPKELVNNHIYFRDGYRDYLGALERKYNYEHAFNDNEKIKAEEDAKNALKRNQFIDRSSKYSKYVFADAFKRYQLNPEKYNPGLGNYISMINNIELELRNEKQLLNYWNTRGKEFYNKGLKEGINAMKKGGILEFLKNGSGIHIKKKNRGKFTEYCGGTVTDECIRRAKSSGNPTLVKRATFAANARKWKHKEGGIIKADDGTKLTTGLKIGNFFNSNWGSFLTSAASNILNAKQLNDLLSTQRDLFKSLNEETYNDLMLQLLSQYLLDLRNKYNKWIQDYQAGLTNDNPSLIVALHQAYQLSAPSISNLEKLFKLKNKAIDLLLASLKADTWINTIGSIAQSGLGLLANKKLATSI